MRKHLRRRLPERLRDRVIRESVNGLLILFGILSAGLGLHGFLLSSNFIDGGVTGVSMLLAKVTPVDLAIWLPLINLPFILLGFRQIGWLFALRSVAAIGGLAAALTVVPFPTVTQDPLLTAVFGGFFIGVGIGLTIRGGAVLDGTDLAALIISRKSQLLRVGDIILIFNVVLFLIAMGILGVEAALYSVLTYVTAAKTLDFVIYGLEEFTSITIVSRHSDEIRDALTGELGRGVTAYRGYGGMSREEQDILLCVVTRLEIGKVKTIVKSIDDSAFIVYHPLAGAEGGVVKRRRMGV